MEDDGIFMDLSTPEIDEESNSDNDASNEPDSNRNIPIPPPPPSIPCLPPPPPPPPPPSLSNCSNQDSQIKAKVSPSVAPAPPPPPPLLQPQQDETDRSLPYIQSNHVKVFSPESTKKTIQLHWKPVSGATKSTVWGSLPIVKLDEEYYQKLFEVKDRKRKRSSSKSSKPVKNLLVLDNKRTNSICIAMKKLPPLSSLKDAIIGMNEEKIDREGIDKLQQLLPSSEELKLIAEHQELNRDLPLGPAEQFLLILGSINNLDARLKLWAFKADFKTMEKEIYEPLKDLKVGMDILQENKTFHTILGVTLAIGNALNRKEAKGFQLDYLTKLAGVKDTAQRKSLMFHITSKVLEDFPACSDLYSEIDPVIRVSRISYNELEADLATMTEQCKNAMNYVKASGKSGTDTEQIVHTFLKDASARIEGLKKIEKRVTKRFQKFNLWLGIPSHLSNEYPPHVVAKIISDLAFQFKTNMLEIKQNEERVKTLKSRKVQRRSAPNLRMAAEDALKDKTDLEELLTRASMVDGRKQSTKELFPMWNSK